MDAARKRLVFDEFFYLQLGLLSRRYREQAKQTSVILQPEGSLITEFYDGLPFELTKAHFEVCHLNLSFFSSDRSQMVHQRSCIKVAKRLMRSSKAYTTIFADRLLCRLDFIDHATPQVDDTFVYQLKAVFAMRGLPHHQSAAENSAIQVVGDFSSMVNLENQVTPAIRQNKIIGNKF